VDSLWSPENKGKVNRWVRAKVQGSRDSTLPPIAADEWKDIRTAQLAKAKETP